MNCRNCGYPLESGQPYCPRCGTSAGYADSRPYDQLRQYAQPQQYSQQDGRYPQSGVYKQPKPPRKTSTVVITMVLIFLSVAIVVGTAAFIITRVWSRTMSVGTAYEEYKQIISDAKDSIDRYAEENDSDPIAIYDMNNSGVDDLVYTADEPDSDEASLNFAMDRNRRIERSQPRRVRDYVIFYRRSDGSLYEYSAEGDVESFYRLSPEDGSRLERYSRRYYEESDEYEYGYSEDGKDADPDDAKERFERFTDELSDDEVVVLVSDKSEDELDELLPSKKELASVGYDEAVEIIDNKLSETETEIDDKDESKGKDEGEKETSDSDELKAKKISLSDIPEQDSLKKFIQGFEFGYHTGAQGKDSQKYDHDDPDKILVQRIVGNPTCVDLSLYPGEKTEEKWSGSDPLGKFDNMGYHLVEKNKALWIMQNIFNISADKASELISEAVDNEDYNIYEYEKGGKTYLCAGIQGVGGPGYEIEFTSARSDGEKYYIIFDRYTYGVSKSEADDLTEYYAEMSLKEIDGKKYWSLYRHSEDIPDWDSDTGNDDTDKSKKATEAPANASEDEVFKLFAGQYTFTSGAGGWGTTMTLEEDGTFSGTFSDSNMAFGSSEYKVELYYSEFSGTFSEPQKVNDYTYSFKLDSIEYVHEPGTEEITDAYTADTKALVKYSTAYGLDNGTKTMYAYTADAPWDELPEGFKSWVSLARYNQTTNDLGRKCLYAVEPEYGWIGSKE